MSLERVPGSKRLGAGPKLCQISPLLAPHAEGGRSARPASRQSLAGAGTAMTGQGGTQPRGWWPLGTSTALLGHSRHPELVSDSEVLVTTQVTEEKSSVLPAGGC